ncbi:hypothetical protein, partial [Rhodoferax sp.]|uniref:hypothetical protein n=1 Tax=Rhodoferax sp. TaxID=50421 RepID=UPI002777C377|nr:hypothetical protein [Rhodoferax sp.]
GHDHGPASAPGGASALPRFSAESDDFELVGVLNGQQLTLYLDRATDNSPVKDAKLELEIGGAKVAVKARGEGEFEATLAQALKPGVVSVTASVVAGAQSDLLAGDWEIPANTRTDANPGRQAWKTYGAWGAGGLLTLALLGWGITRARASRLNAIGGAS